MKKLKAQVVAISLLFLISIVLIVFNLNTALNGLFWDTDWQFFNPEKTVKQSYQSTSQNDLHPIKFGVYDPGRNINKAGFSLESVYISWLDYNENDLLIKLLEIQQQGRIPILVLEPWKKNEDENYLESISRGEYNSEIEQVCQVLNEKIDTLLIAWGHEMDQDLAKRYDWSAQESDAFIQAYRFVHDYISDRIATKIGWIWAPVGKNDCNKYWPGNKYVDLIGLPVYAFPAWDQSYYGYIRPFETTYSEKWTNVQSLNKPIILLEFAASGSNDFTSYWLQESILAAGKRTEIQAIVFFYGKESEGAWGAELPTPDWQSTKASIEGLVTWYTAEVPN